MYQTNQLEIQLPKIFKPFECNQLVRLGKDGDGGYLVNMHDVEKSNLLTRTSKKHARQNEHKKIIILHVQ